MDVSPLLTITLSITFPSGVAKTPEICHISASSVAECVLMCLGDPTIRCMDLCIYLRLGRRYIHTPSTGGTAMALNDAAIRALKPTGRVYVVADEKGLCLEVAVSGSKLWRYRYRFAGRGRNLSF
mgnify:CR=1 FL=1